MLLEGRFPVSFANVGHLAEIILKRSSEIRGEDKNSFATAGRELYYPAPSSHRGNDDECFCRARAEESRYSHLS